MGTELYPSESQILTMSEVMVGECMRKKSVIDLSCHECDRGGMKNNVKQADHHTKILYPMYSI